MVFSQLTLEEYLEFEKGSCQSNFLTGASFIKFQELQGRSFEFVGVKLEEVVVAASMVLKFQVKRFFEYWYAPRGFLVDFSNVELVSFFTNQLKSYAKSKSCCYLITDPYVLYKELDGLGNIVESGFDNEGVVTSLTNSGFIDGGRTIGYGQNFQNFRFMYSVDLKDRDYPGLSLSSKTKANIKKANRFCVKVRELGLDELDIFHLIVAETGENREFAINPLSYYQNQFKAYGEDIKVLLATLDLDEMLAQVDVEICQAHEKLAVIEEALVLSPSSKKSNQLKKQQLLLIENLKKRAVDFKGVKDKHGSVLNLSSAMFIKHGSEITYLTSGSYSEFRNYFGNYAIQEYIIKYALSVGCEKYNMYGISGIFDEADETYGVYKFKQGFGGVVEELIGDFTLVCDPFKYKIIKMLSRS